MDCLAFDREGDVIYLNWEEMMKLSRRLSCEEMGRVIREICELHKEGLLTNGPIARVDPPNEEEAEDGTNP
jgi:hypothetical protein